MIDRGADAHNAACLLRHQMCPQVVLCSGSVEVAVDGRSVGGLTGSRVAGMLGRIPVESTMVDRHHIWRRWGFKANGHILCACSYVDNLFSASSTLAGAIRILEDFEDQLGAKWVLKIKGSSRSCMAAAGSLEQAASEKWPLCHTFVALGHVLKDDGSIRNCWQNTRQSMWKAFWSNSGSRTARQLSDAQRLLLLQKSVVPPLQYRCSRWPPQRMIANELDAIQRKMIANVQRIPRYPGEDVGDFVKRRGRAAAHTCRISGPWSHKWFRRCLDWNEHLERPRNGHSWPAQLLHFRDRQWFIERRASLLPADCGSASCVAGRTSTRAIHGCVHTRWHDGIEFAKQQISK